MYYYSCPVLGCASSCWKYITAFSFHVSANIQRALLFYYSDSDHGRFRNSLPYSIQSVSIILCEHTEMRAYEPVRVGHGAEHTVKGYDDEKSECRDVVVANSQKHWQYKSRS